MITKKQAKLLERIIINRHLGSGCVWVNARCADKELLDQIKADHPDAITYLYGGSAQTVGDHEGCVCFHTEPHACSLLEEYQANEIVGYDGRASVVERWDTVEFDFHFRAESMAKLRAQLKRARGYRVVTIIKARPMTHAEWVSAYGWGRM